MFWIQFKRIWQYTNELLSPWRQLQADYSAFNSGNRSPESKEGQVYRLPLL
jgi:hypothetical protein